MPSIRWATIASEIMKEGYVTRDGKCKICNEKIFNIGDRSFAKLKAIYQHFNQKHQNTITEIKQKLTNIKPQFNLDKIFPTTPTPKTEEAEEEEEEKEEIETGSEEETEAEEGEEEEEE